AFTSSRSFSMTVRCHGATFETYSSTVFSRTLGGGGGTFAGAASFFGSASFLGAVFLGATFFVTFFFIAPLTPRRAPYLTRRARARQTGCSSESTPRPVLRAGA